MTRKTIRKGEKRHKPVVSDKRRSFAREYLVDLNGTAAAKRAGYSERTAGTIAWELLRDPRVQAMIQEEMCARAERTAITADQVLKDLWAISQADPRELVEYRRTCCRYCWGKDFRYQRTAGELERDREAHRKALLDATAAKRKLLGAFDEKGGAGYHAKRDPNQECIECFGDGVGDTFVHDTRKLSPAAVRLFAGVKQTKEGLEVKTHDQKSALVDVGEHLGMFKKKHEHTGADGKPLPPAQIVPVFNITLTAEEE